MTLAEDKVLAVMSFNRSIRAGVGAEASPKDQRKGADVESLAAQMNQIATSKVVRGREVNK